MIDPTHGGVVRSMVSEREIYLGRKFIMENNTESLIVIDRKGEEKLFDAQRITRAVEKAAVAAKSNLSHNELASITDGITAYELFQDNIIDNKIQIEQIQDAIVSYLNNQHREDIAKVFESYREQRDKLRHIDYKKLIDKYVHESDWRVKENSTVTYSLGGLILSNSGSITANYWLSEIYDQEIAQAHINADIHIHDLSMLSAYCAGWSLRQLIAEGLGGIEGRISSSPAKHLSTLCNQMVNFLGCLQNEWAGAQAFSSFDTYLAPFVKAENLSYKEVKQNIESFIFGVNTPSRWGCVDSETEVLAESGFKKYNELTTDDNIYCWQDGELQLHKVNKVVVKPFKGELHSYKAKGYNQTVTPNHRVLVKDAKSKKYRIRLSSSLGDDTAAYNFPIAFTKAELDGNKLSDAEIHLAAIIYANRGDEASTNNAKKFIFFNKINHCSNDLISRLSNELGLKYQIIEGKESSVCQYIYTDKSAKKLVDLVGCKTGVDGKFLALNSFQSYLFISTWAEPCKKDGGLRCRYTSNEDRDALQHISLRAGRASYTYTHRGVKYVKLRAEEQIQPEKKTLIKYDGLVWCPNVEPGTAVFRKDGCVFISGQTQAPFTNITLDWIVPDDLKNQAAMIGGEFQDFNYGDCQAEVDMVNKAFLEVMIAGDANGRGFQYPIPTYSITKDFDWSETENNKLLFEMTAKYGTPYFANYINSDMSPQDTRSMCCRLRLDLRELRKKAGGYFGSGESTGSVGVVTINIPRLAYLAQTADEFYNNLDKLMDISARSLNIKRKFINRLLNDGMYPYTKRYLGSLNNHFSTIGLVGMNEACLNAKWISKDLTHEEAQNFAKEVLTHMRERLVRYQSGYDTLFNLEATPAESTAYRLAKHDRELYPHILCAGTEASPYYTNSSHLPVGSTDDIFEALDIQDDLQVLYTSGTVFHAFLGERLPNWKSAAVLVRKIAEKYQLPYYTLSPTYSICKDHGYIVGETKTCPQCGAETEVYSRITGYYRPVKNWNTGKAQEFKERKVYGNGDLL